ncbi:PREDICTED: uncharacterized protein LOC109164509 isoform X2 [Ipomoea nil]|uniref:uncharacterized protein LOC109164509 isoform X2 n=1 Tax=Ipomoea nil TaxID=35883 RepID=UPI000901CE9A|nr:PREDICTED: uncharacterized protein LOC109164509 isoform X2 [Ipomoea nil]
MATAWLTIGNRAAPIDSNTTAPAGTPANGNTTPANSPSTPSGLNASEVTFNPQSYSNPYYLHINESPALELVSCPQLGSSCFESQLHQTGENNSTPSAFLTRTEGGSQTGYKRAMMNNKRPVCTHCGYTGHTEDKCYKKHGYPPGWKPKSRNQGAVNQVLGSQQFNSNGSMIFTQEDFKKFLSFMQSNEPAVDGQNSPLDQPSKVLVNTVSADLQMEDIV